MKTKLTRVVLDTGTCAKCKSLLIVLVLAVVGVLVCSGCCVQSIKARGTNANLLSQGPARTGAKSAVALKADRWGLRYYYNWNEVTKREAVGLPRLEMGANGLQSVTEERIWYIPHHEVRTRDQTKILAAVLERVEQTPDLTARPYLVSGYYTLDDQAPTRLVAFWDVFMGVPGLVAPIPVFWSYELELHVELLSPDDRRVLASRDTTAHVLKTGFSIWGLFGERKKDFATVAVNVARQMADELQ